MKAETCSKNKVISTVVVDDMYFLPVVHISQQDATRKENVSRLVLQVVVTLK
jgi:hypothetical protein